LKSFYRLLPSVSVLVFYIPFAQAQSAIDINTGFGGPGIAPTSPASTMQIPLPVFWQLLTGFGRCSLSVAARVELLLSGVWRRRDGQAEVRPGCAVHHPTRQSRLWPAARPPVVLRLQCGLPPDPDQAGGFESGSRNRRRANLLLLHAELVCGNGNCTTLVSPVGTASHSQEHPGAGVQFVSDRTHLRSATIRYTLCE
jgi:hypothetical protein